MIKGLLSGSTEATMEADVADLIRTYRDALATRDIETQLEVLRFAERNLSLARALEGVEAQAAAEVGEFVVAEDFIRSRVRRVGFVTRVLAYWENFHDRYSVASGLISALATAVAMVGFVVVAMRLFERPISSGKFNLLLMLGLFFVTVVLLNSLVRPGRFGGGTSRLSLASPRGAAIRGAVVGFVAAAVVAAFVFSLSWRTQAGVQKILAVKGSLNAGESKDLFLKVPPEHGQYVVATVVQEKTADPIELTVLDKKGAWLGYASADKGAAAVRFRAEQGGEYVVRIAVPQGTVKREIPWITSVFYIDPDAIDAVVPR